MVTRDVYESGFDEDDGRTHSTTECPECTGTLVTEGGETSCTECGLITDEYRYDHGATPGSYADEANDHEQTGAPLTPARHDRGLSTEIGSVVDGKGNHISHRKQRQLHRLRRQHARGRWRTKAEQNLGHACGEIARMASALDLPYSVCEEAASIYRDAHRENLIRGRSIETMAAGSLYAACRCRGDVRTISGVADVARCSKDKVHLGYRVLNVELGLEARTISARERIPRLASACAVPDSIQHRALKLAGLADETGLANGRNPAGVAAACLYLASRDAGGTVTQAELARHADVTPVTLRARYRELQEASS